MIRITNAAKEVTVEQITNLFHCGEIQDKIIFYYSRNETYPLFMKKGVSGSYGFMSPIFGRSVSYKGDTFIESLEKALSQRKVFMEDVDKWNEVFKKKKRD